MLNISKVPFDEVHPELQQRMVESDDALGGSEWIQVFPNRRTCIRRLSIFTTNTSWSKATASASN